MWWSLPALMSIACASPQWKDGDIVLHKSQSAQSGALREATGSPYTHVGMLFERNGSWQVLEAVQPVRWTPLSKWRARGADGHMVVVRADDPLTSDEASRLRAAGEAYLGKPYDVLFEWSDDRIYCSELVTKAYATIGREVGDKVPLRSFALDGPKVKALIRKRAAQNLDLDEPVVAPASLLDHPGFHVVYDR